MASPSRAECLQILGLFNLAVAHPLLDLIVSSSGVVVASGIGRGEAVLLVLIPCLVAPAAILLLEAAVGRLAPAALRILHAFLVAQLAGLLVMRALRLLVPEEPVWAVIAQVQTVALVVLAYLSWAWVRAFFTAFAPAALIVPVMILASAPLQQVMRAAAPASAPVSAAGPPVVVVLFDELPLVSLLDENRQIDAERYPSFAALAKTSTWYRNATTVAAHTTQALPSLFTGCYPDAPGYEAGTDPQSKSHLFAHMARTHRLEVFEAMSNMAPARRGKELDARPAGAAGRVADLLAFGATVTLARLLGSEGGAGTVIGEVDAMAAQRDPVYRLQAFEKIRLPLFLDAIRADAPPTFYFYHCLQPHGPWNQLPSGRFYDASLWVPKPDWPPSQWVCDYGQQRHLLSTGLADRTLDRIVERLREQDLLDRCVLLVLSDHGVSFLPGRHYREPYPEVVGDIAPVPLFLKLPGQRQGAVSDRNVELVDVTPTLAEAVGTPLGWMPHGSSLLGPDPERPTKWLHRAGVLPPRVSLDASRWRRKLELFGTGGFDDRFYGLGPAPELVGRVAAPLVVKDGRPPPHVNLERAYAYDTVWLGSPSLPVCVEGQVGPAAPGEKPLAIAIAINGRIQAAAAPQPGTAGWYAFSAMVAETSLREGSNDVQVYWVERTPSGLRLRPTTQGR